MNLGTLRKWIFSRWEIVSNEFKESRPETLFSVGEHGEQELLLSSVLPIVIAEQEDKTMKTIPMQACVGQMATKRLGFQVLLFQRNYCFIYGKCLSFWASVFSPVIWGEWAIRVSLQDTWSQVQNTLGIKKTCKTILWLQIDARYLNKFTREKKMFLCPEFFPNFIFNNPSFDHRSDPRGRGW